MGKRRAGSQTDSLTPDHKKSGIDLFPTFVAVVRHGVGKLSTRAITFVLNLVPIRAWGEKLWFPKVPGVQTGTVSGLLLGSPGKKSHLDVASVRSCREYYKGEGGGFPPVRAMVSQVSPS